jgi:heme/copper-type cytochrome/quinol oxidase subunit 4
MTYSKSTSSNMDFFEIVVMTDCISHCFEIFKISIMCVIDICVFLLFRLVLSLLPPRDNSIAVTTTTTTTLIIILITIYVLNNITHSTDCKYRTEGHSYCNG